MTVSYITHFTGYIINVFAMLNYNYVFHFFSLIAKYNRDKYVINLDVRSKNIYIYIYEVIYLIFLILQANMNNIDYVYLSRKINYT